MRCARRGLKLLIEFQAIVVGTVSLCEDPEGVILHTVGARHEPPLPKVRQTSRHLSLRWPRHFREISADAGEPALWKVSPVHEELRRALYEFIANITTAQRLSYNRLVIKAVIKFEVSPPAGLGDTADVRKTTLFPLALIMPMEVYTIGNREPACLRLIALAELIKTYDVLRGGDLTGAMTSPIRFGSYCFIQKLRRTKSASA